MRRGVKTQGPGDSRAFVSHGPAPPHLPATFRRDERLQRCVLVVGRLHDEAVELVHRRAAADYTASRAEGHRWGEGGGDQDAAAAETKLQGRAEAGLSGQRGPAKMDCAKEMGRASFPGKLEPVTGATQEVNRGDLLRPGECPAYVGTNQTTGIKQGA